MAGKWRWCAMGLLVAWSGVVPARAAEIVERVVAVVNEDAIFLSDLRKRAIPFLGQAMAAPDEVQRMARMDQLYKELLELLIEERLLRQTAEQMQLAVSPEDVQTAIGNVQSQSGMTQDQFWQAVREQGMTPAEYRADVQRQLIRLKVLNLRARGRVNVTDTDVRRRYEGEIRKARHSGKFRVSHIFREVADDADATTVARVRKEMDSIRAGLTPKNFFQAIAQHGGGDLGWLQQGDLPEPLEQVLIAMEPGQISAPVRGPSGFHVFFLRERQAGEGGVHSYEEAKPALQKQMMDESMARQEKLFLEELKRQAIINRLL